MKAKVFANNILLGMADLKIGDYSMGGLYGIFTPNEYYIKEIQQQVKEFNEQNNKDFQKWDSYNFKVKLVNGYILEPMGGIVIADFNEMFGEPIQIELAGVACDIIDKYFDVKK